ncbi:dehydrogenase/reductase SDR family member 13-like isoform X2 [Penaeus chinensis]|uniref:dehydrogenase/reductase SDR family member 13-like isoform X2 n=1 Tax=Penaeus chinensis TaxID=139456 RepID=UPI001FB75253|nr:dehydrogenase/reductase SDR family member 13-like isoform X2 [Penaeus chinensis]
MVATFLNAVEATRRQIISAGYILLKWKNPLECRCQNRVRGKVVVITGATSGIGRFTAFDLARKGALVYLAGRSREAGATVVREVTQATGNRDVHFLPLDLTEFSSIVTFVQEFLRCEEKLDVLVNNAAVFHHPPKQTQHNLEIVFQTNYLGVFLLSSLLLDTLRHTPNSQLIFVSSEAHRLVSLKDVETFDPREAVHAENFDDHIKLYGISKLALRIFAQFVAESFPASVLFLNERSAQDDGTGDELIPSDDSDLDIDYEAPNNDDLDFVSHNEPLLDSTTLDSDEPLSAHVNKTWNSNGILVTEVNPGNVWTPIYRHAWLSWRDMLKRLLCSLLMQDVQEGAQPLIHALNSSSLQSGIYLSDILQAEGRPGYDPAVTQRLLAASVELTGKYLDGTPKEIYNFI